MKKIELFVALLLVISMAFVILSCNNDRTVDTDTMYTGTEQISTESEVKTRETVKTVETADTAETEETTDTTEMTNDNEKVLAIWVKMLNFAAVFNCKS